MIFYFISVQNIIFVENCVLPAHWDRRNIIKTIFSLLFFILFFSFLSLARVTGVVVLMIMNCLHYTLQHWLAHSCHIITGGWSRLYWHKVEAASPTPHTCHMLPKHTSHRHPAHPAQTQAAPGVITDQALLIKSHKLLIFLLLSKKGVTFKYNK